MKNDFENCSLYLKELDSLDRFLVIKATQHLSENELQKYISIFSKRQDFLFSFTHNISQKNTLLDLKENAIEQTCYNNILFYKGFLLGIVEQTKHLAALDSSNYEKFNLHRSYLRCLAQQYSKVIGERDSNYVVDLEMKANVLEKDLAKSMLLFQTKIQQARWQDVQNKLKRNEAAIEFVHYQYSKGGIADSTYYAALIITKDMKNPYFCPLFEKSKLNAFFLIKGDQKVDYVNALYTIPDRGFVHQGDNITTMYELLWKPLEGQLKGINRIYFSPSGLLHRINLNAVPISNEETLADRYQFIELNSTRKLLDDNEIIINNNDAVLYGGINFEKDTTLSKMESTSNDVAMASRSVSEFSFNSIDSTLRGGSWAYLLGTEREVNALEKIMQSAKVSVKLVKGFAATEESIKSIGKNKMPSPRMLHIATHGFFFPDPKVNTVFGSLNNQESNVFKTSDHPMMRSGLIMSGGNAAWNKMNSSNDKEDGILTAYDLQRAFKIAGAKYLIMSLWQVPDKQTSLLMTTFYKKWLLEKLSIPQAFQGAQKELRDLGFDPYQWAGFVLVE
ncbi:MAG: CHAT domain-containing protein [Saprospiraceae bacterium]|nr:CHAT domain-containing protein [Candidatus Defluviibacterium haderslevense]